ncbi:hypothetical protein Tco_1215618 [Tanacetum coccineum]
MPSDIQYSAATRILEVLQIAVMSSTSSAVTYTSVYTDSESGLCQNFSCNSVLFGHRVERYRSANLLLVVKAISSKVMRELSAKVNKAPSNPCLLNGHDDNYTSIYTDSEPCRAFWGVDDEEISEGGIPRVIVLGYDGLPLQPVAPPSPDYILGPENLQILPVPQDEDEREPMFIQAHDPDYVPEPIYPSIYLGG